jgi:hypothetical protein
VQPQQHRSRLPTLVSYPCGESDNRHFTMSHTEIDEQIERLRKGDTLPENEVKALCEKVSKPMATL